MIHAEAGSELHQHLEPANNQVHSFYHMEIQPDSEGICPQKNSVKRGCEIFIELCNLDSN